MNNKIFPQSSFERPKSRPFIDACKYNDEQTAFLMLLRDRYLVHQFDHIKMTALHWACKRGFLRIAKMLIDNNADIEAQDLVKIQKIEFSLISPSSKEHLFTSPLTAEIENF